MTLQYSKDGVRLGAVSPVSLVLDLTGDGTLDFTTVATADVHLRRPDAEELHLVAVPISLQTTVGLTLTHPWASGEVSQAGKWAVYATLFISGGGSIDTAPGEFKVFGPFEPVIKSLPP